MNSRSHLSVVLLSLLLAMTACVTQPPAPVKPPEVLAAPPAPGFHSDLSEAVQFIAVHLPKQVAIKDMVDAKVIPVDLFFNEHSAEEAAASKNLQTNLIAALASVSPDAKFSPLSTQNIQNAQWVTVASYASIKASEAGKSGQWLRLKVALVEIKTGTVKAQVITHVNADQFNTAPTRFYKNAPMYLTDASHQDRNAVLAGQRRPLGDGLLVRAALTEAAAAFEAERWAEAEQGFQNVLTLAPHHTGALSGLYQVLWVTGRKAEAEKAFARLSAASVEAGSLSVKLLFKLGSTDFVDEGDLAQQYQIWLRAMAQTVNEKKVCLNINGHASASGAADFNQRLSLSRANRIATRMQQLVAMPKGRLAANGKGNSEMVVGTGTDDAADAIDRRVEFVVRACN